MKIAVLGTGMVGNAIGTKLAASGHDTKMGSRSAHNEAAAAWVKAAGKNASAGTFADAARHGEIVFNCTSGQASLSALESAGAQNLAGKILVDIANPLDFSKGMPPTLTVCNTDSLAEQIQRAFPSTKVVKTLNTVNCNVMVDPSRVKGGETTMFVCGDDAAAKKTVVDDILRPFWWKDIIDLGPLSQARATEMYLALWVRLFGTLQTPDFNVKVVR